MGDQAARGCGVAGTAAARRAAAIVDPRWAAATLNPEVTLQGNLDPLALIAGGEALQRDVAAIREGYARGKAARWLPA